eukprot:14557213-Alexandrium_andersonii.AAC.1
MNNCDIRNSPHASVTSTLLPPGQLQPRHRANSLRARAQNHPIAFGPPSPPPSPPTEQRQAREAIAATRALDRATPCGRATR